MITVTAFKQVPPFARGLVRDLRVRWAAEEAGVPYKARPLSPGETDSPEYRAIQPWGQVPVIEDEGLTLFESGAIVWRIAEKSAALCPQDDAGRAKALQWTFAALNSIEPHMMNYFTVDIFFANEAWAKARKPSQEAFTRMKLQSLAKRLAGRDYLEDRFTVGDLMMTTVLRMLNHTDIVLSDPVLGPYVMRCQSRPAFQRALAAQLADFEELEAA